MLKTVFAAGLMLSPAILLAQSDQMGNGMSADTTASASGSAAHHSGGHTMHHGSRHTTRGASLSNDTASTPNTSNSKSGPLNSNPH